MNLVEDAPKLQSIKHKPNLLFPPNTRKLRHEWKHLITLSDKMEIISRLQKIASPDPNYGNESYNIRSLYFDNAYDKALLEKLSGFAVREKFRIRLYNNDDSYIRLEKKNKIKSLCEKQSQCITREQCERLTRGDFEWLLKCDSILFQELYAKMSYQLFRAKVIVDYKRRAFVYKQGNVRITIDYDIRTGLSSTELFSHNLLTIPSDIRSPIILEVKYDEYLPTLILDAIQVSNRNTESFSKYVSCRLTNY